MRSRVALALSLAAFSAVLLLPLAKGHGRLIDPPARSTAWRFGFHTPVNYNDNEVFCGGFSVQWGANKGKCGVCGDAFNGARDHEFPTGKYARQLVVTKTYTPGSEIDAKVQLTTSHRGYFTFKLCPATSDTTEVSQDCLDAHVLELAQSHSQYTYAVQTSKPEVFDVKLRLPEGLECERCVLQWTYTAGNNWGRCADGKSSRVGCGPQETFRGCADVRIAAGQQQEPPGAIDEIEREGPPLIRPTTTGRPSIPRAPPRSPPRASPRPRPPSARPARPVPTKAPTTTSTSRPRTFLPRIPVATTRRARLPTTRRRLYPQPSVRPASNPTRPPPRPSSPPRHYTSAPPRRVSPSPSPPMRRGGQVSCAATTYMRSTAGLDAWCENNCSRGFCPSSHCACI